MLGRCKQEGGREGGPGDRGGGAEGRGLVNANIHCVNQGLGRAVLPFPSSPKKKKINYQCLYHEIRISGLFILLLPKRSS